MQWNSGIWWWGHCLWCKKVKPVDALDSFHSTHTTICHYYTASTVSTAYCIHCAHWFDLFAPRTMSPPPYIFIPLHLLSPLCKYCVHCLLHLLHAAYTTIPLCPLCTAYCVHWFDPFAPKTVPTTIYHYSTASTALTFFVSKTMSPPPYTTIPLHTAYCVHCVLHPLCTASTACPTWPT